MKRGLFGVLLLGLGFALACGGGDGTSKPRSSRTAGPEGYKADFAGECKALLGEFGKDEKAAHDKYKYKTVFITGTARTDLQGQTMRLDGTDAVSYCNVQTFSGSAAKKAKAWTKGGKVEALCSYKAYKAGVLKLEDCSPYLPDAK